VSVANRRDEADAMRNLINFESQTTTDCFLPQSRDGAASATRGRLRQSTHLSLVALHRRIKVARHRKNYELSVALDK